MIHLVITLEEAVEDLNAGSFNTNLCRATHVSCYVKIVNLLGSVFVLYYKEGLENNFICFRLVRMY